uniref:KH domain-containing, RNA-binding, signal transduction-associated protein 1 n=1 Tax=Periophthalmus magnuspinnatus TaxID=409849 RepID=A0A3B4AAP2_9GOBI
MESFPQKKTKMDDKYLPELLAEKDSLDASFTHAMKLISAEIERIQKGETKKDNEKETYLDLFATKNLKLKERVLIPIKQFPRVNFVGKILGPGGNTIKRLQEETGAKISVLGKGSMKDKNKEEELRKGGEAKYTHLSMELHVFIEVHAPIPEAYLRMAHAMDEVKKFLTPVCFSTESNPILPHHCLCSARGGRGMPRGGPRGGLRGAPRGAPGRGGGSRGTPAGRGAAASRGAAGRSRPPAAGAPRMLPSAAKAEGYEDYPAYDESYTEAPYEGYDYYSQQAAPTDTEYYDYGHGEAQDAAYESYTQDDWEGSWSSAGAGGKAPPARQSKGAYREHPYGRY